MSTDENGGPITEAEPALRPDGVFRAPALEAAFRRRYLAEDSALAAACLLVPMVGGVILTLIDVRVLRLDRQFYELLAVRLLSVLVALGIWLRLRRCATPGALDTTVLFMVVAAALLSLYVSQTRPPGHIGHAMVNVLLVGLFYSVVPLPLVWQIALGIPFSVAYVGSLPAHGIVLGELSMTTIVAAAFAMANVLGIVTSWRLNRRRRLAFAAMLRETELRLRLEQALAEVRTLRGCLSICAWCKRVRDEEEVWQAVENYVAAHTHAEFTHGICPVCLEQFTASNSVPNG